MEIVKIIQSAYHEGSYNVFFEDGTKVRVFSSVISDFQLFEGKDMSREDIYGLEAACECHHLERLAQLYIKGLGRPAGKAEIVEYLTKLGARRDIADGTAIRLEYLDIINEKEYGELIAGNLLKRCYGPEKIRAELFYNNIDEAVARDIMERLPDPATALDWAYENKLNEKRGKEAYLEFFRKTMLRRGFRMEDIEGAERRYVEKHGALVE